MDTITQFINQFLFYITITIIGIESVMSLLDRLGLLPSFFEKIYISRDKRTITLTLQELGLAEKRSLIRQTIDYWRSETLVTNINAKAALIDLVLSTTRQLGTEVGLYKKVRLRYYIDLAEHTTDWEKLDVLAQLMCSSIRGCLASLDNPIQIDKIAASPGNPALALVTAAQMKKPFVSVIAPKSPLASDPISGKIEKEDHVILVHDVVLTGYRLADIAGALRDAGAKVGHAFVLVERTDSKKGGGETPSETLEKNGIKLHSILSIDDDDIAAQLKRRRKR